MRNNVRLLTRAAELARTNRTRTTKRDVVLGLFRWALVTAEDEPCEMFDRAVSCTCCARAATYLESLIYDGRNPRTPTTKEPR